MLAKAWEFIVRARTWIVNMLGAALVFLPLLGAPEVMAVIPEGYQKYVIALAFIINIWMRPRLAVVKKDVE